jgi:hypothetical protein
MVHVPDDGNPLSATLPVDNAHVGCIIGPTTGAAGVTGWVLITIFEDDADVQPDALATVNVWVPVSRPDTVVLVPVPVVVSPPGVWVRVHVPAEGSPLSTTLPVATVHVGWVIVPTEGVAGLALTVSEYVATATGHGNTGLLVVTVTVTILPASAAAGV